MFAQCPELKNITYKSSENLMENNNIKVTPRRKKTYRNKIRRSSCHEIKVENLEVLRLKGFLDVITDKLWDNDTEILPYIIRCIQGFCQEQSCIDNILRRILKIF